MMKVRTLIDGAPLRPSRWPRGFALLALLLAIGLVFLTSRSDLRHAAEIELMGWLKARHETMAVTAGASSPGNSIADISPNNTDNNANTVAASEPEPVERAVAVHLKDLPHTQAAVALWLSRKYGVAAEPLSLLVKQAFDIGQKARLDPTLILAIMAIESGFNPFAQSPVGAQGLMQVMTKIHQDKYEDFGGQLAAFDPVVNLRVGVKVLQECIARAGSIEGGLKFYVGAANLPDDGGYTSKVLSEHARLQAVAVAAAKGTGSKLSFVLFSPAPAQKAPSGLMPSAATEPAAAVPVDSAKQQTLPDSHALLAMY